MQSRFIRSLLMMELEERILNSAIILTLISVFLPWLSGEWLGGERVTYSGFGFFTSFLGFAIFSLHLFLLMITIFPLLGGPVLIKKRHREIIRFAVAFQATILILACLSVLTKVTFEFRMEIRFGIYLALIGSIVTTTYAFLKFQEHRRSQAQEHFHHPEDAGPPASEEPELTPLPPPPPPPPPPPEEHRLYP